MYIQILNQALGFLNLEKCAKNQTMRLKILKNEGLNSHLENPWKIVKCQKWV